MGNLKEIELYSEKTFDDIKHIDEYGNEYWLAMELQVALEYKEWRKFRGVIDKAKEACANSSFEVSEQLVEVDKLSRRNNNAVIKII